MEELIKPETHLLSRFQMKKLLAQVLTKERKKLLDALT